uniref:Uncharacterized protein n=1 Tax=Strix occidentalis caurina TaxID=311401 RepID=A0A8D0EWK2_STROC
MDTIILSTNIFSRKVACQWNMFPSEAAEPLFGLDALQWFLPPHIFETSCLVNHLLAREVQVCVHSIAR